MYEICKCCGKYKKPNMKIIISSPPYSEGLGHGGEPTREAGRGMDRNLDGMQDGYGHTPGNLANMKEGKFEAVIGSPNFPLDQPCQSQSKSKKDYHSFTRGDGTKRDHQMRSDGNLGSMREGNINSILEDNRKWQSEGEFSVIVSSPPYEHSETTTAIIGDSREEWYKKRNSEGRRYSKTNIDNLGNTSGDTFWSASREIVQGCYDLLKPGGHAIWVCKDYVKAGKRIPFSNRWLALCESIGFRLVCRHQAMLVKEHGSQLTLEGGEEGIETSRKSFFRRLAEKKGSPAIDFEDVICLEKG
jgi:hypothetical protein